MGGKSSKNKRESKKKSSENVIVLNKMGNNKIKKEDVDSVTHSINPSSNTINKAVIQNSTNTCEKPGLTLTFDKSKFNVPVLTSPKRKKSTSIRKDTRQKNRACLELFIMDEYTVLKVIKANNKDKEDFELIKCKC